MMTGMRPRDQEIWRAIDQGHREIDWEAWFGCPEGADYLSPAGHEVTARAVADLSAFFDSRWLPKAVPPSSTPGRASDTFVAGSASVRSVWVLVWCVSRQGGAGGTWCRCRSSSSAGPGWRRESGSG